MKETIRPAHSEIVDRNRDSLVRKAKLGMSTLKAATEERQAAERSIRENTYYESPEQRKRLDNAQDKEDAAEMRSLRHFRENRAGYEQAARDEAADRYLEDNFSESERTAFKDAGLYPKEVFDIMNASVKKDEEPDFEQSLKDAGLHREFSPEDK